MYVYGVERRLKMSEMEYLKGKLVLVDEVTNPNETNEHMFYRFLVKRGFEFNEEEVAHAWDGMYEEMFIDEFYKEYVCVDNKIYEVTEIEDCSGDMFEAEKNSDGSISFNLIYYNGGVVFDEAVCWAFDDMERKKIE